MAGAIPEKDQAANQLGIRFGYNASGDLYYPSDAVPDAKLPVVIWLHGYGYALGYEWSYRRDRSPILALVKAGYAVFAFDQIGFGSRIAEAGRFYDRYPHWSAIWAAWSKTPARQLICCKKTQDSIPRNLSVWIFAGRNRGNLYGSLSTRA